MERDSLVSSLNQSVVRIPSNSVLHSELFAYQAVGAFGVFGYTGDGISKSLDRAIHGKTMKHVMASKQAEAEHLARKQRISSANGDIVEAFSQPRALKA